MLGIAGRLQVPKKLLAILVTGLLIEVGGSVIFLFKTIDITEMTAQEFINNLPPDLQAQNIQESRDNIIRTYTKPSAHDFINDLPKEFKNMAPQYARDKIIKLIQDVNRIGPLESKIEENKLELADTKSKNVNLEKKNKVLQVYEQHFLVKLIKLRRDAAEFGRTLNLIYPEHPKKRLLAKQIQELLAELGYYDETPDGDPVKTRDVLIKYQRAKGFSVLGWFSSDVVDVMMADYLKLGTII